MQSYLNKTFALTILTPRVRQDGDLLSFVMEDGKPKLTLRARRFASRREGLDEPSVFVNAEIGMDAPGILRISF